MNVDILVLFTTLGRKQAVFTIMYDVSYRFFIDALYQIKRFPIMPPLNNFIRKEWCTLWNAFSVPIEMIIGFWYFILLTWCITLLTWVDWNTLALPGQIPLGDIQFFYTLVGLVCKHFVGNFGATIHKGYWSVKFFCNSVPKSILQFAGCHRATHTVAVTTSWSWTIATPYFKFQQWPQT